MNFKQAIPAKKVIILESRQADIQLINYFIDKNIEVKIKNINYLPNDGVFGRFIYGRNIEQLPPDCLCFYNKDEYLIMAGEGYEKNPHDNDCEKTINTELQMLMQLCEAKIILVTGSFGKQTTTALLSDILELSGFSVFRRERYTNTVMDCLGKIYDYIIVDITLEELKNHDIKSDALIVTNISPYPQKPKKSFIGLVNAIAHQTNNNRIKSLVLNDDNYFCKIITKNTVLKPCLFSYKRADRASVTFLNGKIARNEEEIIDTTKDCEYLKLCGNRNIECYLAAIAAMTELLPGIDKNIIKKAVFDFKGAKNHMEYIGEKRGRKYFSNLYSTTPAQTVAALTAFKENIILITGGTEKEVNFKALGMEVVYFCKAVILLGKASTEIKRAIEGYEYYNKKIMPVFKVADIHKAVQLANHLSKKEDSIIFSYSSHDNSDMSPYMHQRCEYVSAISLL